MLKINKLVYIYLPLVIVFTFLFLSVLIGGSFQAKVIIPSFCIILLGIITSLLLFYFVKDKFIPKIFYITFIFRLVTAIVLYLLKYYVLDLPVTDGVASIGIDNDNMLYNHEALFISANFSSVISNLSEYTFHFYGIIVGIIYKIFGQNEFNATAINCYFAGFTPIAMYLIGKIVLPDRKEAKLLAYLTTFSFTVSAYSAVMMRDVFIQLFSFVSIYFGYYLFRKQNLITLLAFLSSLYILNLFRPYASFAILGSFILAFLFVTAKITYTSKKLKVNPSMLILLAFIPIIVGLLFYYQSYLGLDYIISLFDMEQILLVSEQGYGGANSSFGVDRMALASFLPGFLAFGYFCMFFAPFPHQWLLAKNIVQAFASVETIFLYLFVVPSFFFGIKKGFKEKNMIVLTSTFFIFSIFAFYGMILDNSGAVFRGRAPFIPLIFMIGLYNSKWILTRLKQKILSFM